MNTITYLNEKIERARELDFGTIFNQSIELFKKTWLQGFVLQLLTFILVIPFLIIFYVPFFAMVITESQDGHFNSEAYDAFFAGLSILTVILYFVSIFVISAVSIALNAAFYRIIKKLDDDEDISVNDFFVFLKGKYLSKAFMLTVVSILLAIPATLLCFFPMLYIMVPLTFFTLIFAFNPELSVSEIVNVSFKLGNKKWLLTFGLIIVSSIVASTVGFLLCGIGTLFTAAFVYLPTYYIYKEVIGFNTKDDLDTIGLLEE